MMMPNRHKSGSSSDNYRYGFNGQEKDDEVAGDGNSYTAEYWQYDPRIAKRWNPDPVVKYHESRYAVFANNPLRFVDRIGKDTLSVIGKNGSMISFIHKDLEKRQVELPFALNLDQNISLNFDKIGDGKLPDVLGYSLTGSINGDFGGGAGSVSISKSFIFFTRGNYAYNPFSYTSAGAKVGSDFINCDAGISFTGTLSLFGANWKNAESNEDRLSKLKPYSWTEWFDDASLSLTGFAGLGGGGGISGFQTPGVLDGGQGYLGFSLDITVGIGGGSDDGAEASATLTAGRSYYLLNEHFPEPTLKLMNSTIGKARLALKWSEFMSGGMVPGTSASDVLKVIGDMDNSKPSGRNDYPSPTFLNGFFGNKL